MSVRSFAMPLPAIPVLLQGVSAALGGIGALATGKARMDKAKAAKTRQRAQEKFNKAMSEVQAACDVANEALSELGLAKAQVAADLIARVVAIANRVHRAEDADFADGDTTLKAPLARLPAMREEATKASEILAVGLKATSTGALAGFGAFGLASSIGTASTGTAISSLSGAAATKATWAWLGGGAIKAGGAGVAGGMATVAGVVAGPAVAYAGISMAIKAAEQLTEAVKVEAQVDVMVERSKTDIVKLRAGRDRALSVRGDLYRLAFQAQAKITALEGVLATYPDGRVPFRSLTPEQVELYKTVLFLASSLYELMAIDIASEMSPDPEPAASADAPAVTVNEAANKEG